MGDRSPSSKTSNWFFEALSLLAALTLVACLVIVLFNFDNQDIQTWQYPITINTLASFITLIFRACPLIVVCECISQWKWILFHRPPYVLIDFERIDRASRGPLGSTWLFLSAMTRTRAVRLGAIAMLLTMALDPFTQQIIQLRDITSFQTDLTYRVQSGVHFADAYIAGELYREDSTRHDNGSLVTFRNTVTSIDMQSAILFGLSHSVDEVKQQTPWTCQTADCRWPEYTSLAVCSECVNNTDQIHQVRGNSIDICHGYNKGNVRGLGDDATAFSLPNGQFIVNLDGSIIYSNQSVLGYAGQSIYRMTASGTGDPNSTVALQNRSTLIWATNILSLLPGPKGYQGQWPGVPLASQECGLYWCIKQYKSQVSNNTFEEQEEEIDSTFDLEKYRSGIAEEDWPIRSLDFVENLTTDSNGPNAARICPKDNNGTSCGEIYPAAVLSTNHYFHKAFTAKLTPDNATANLGPGRFHNEGHLLGYWALPDTFNGLWTWDKHEFDAKFEAMAKSMSNVVRSVGSVRDLRDRDTSPEVGRTTTHCHIEWRWISLHGVVAALSTVFLALTVWQCRRTGSPPLKSSALAVLKHGPYISDALEGAETPKELNSRARNRSAMLLGTSPTSEIVGTGLLMGPMVATVEAGDGIK